MTDVVVTVPKRLWADWLDEGALAGEAMGLHPLGGYHFTLSLAGLPTIEPGERVYIVAHGKLRGYARLCEIERRCRLWPSRSCLMRRGGAVALTIDEPIRGFQGWRYRWWEYEDEKPFPEWQKP